LPTKDAVLARRKAWRDRAQTAPSMRSASASEAKRWIMGQQCGLCAPFLTSSGALLKDSFEYRAPAATPSVRTRRFTLVLKTSTILASASHRYRLADLGQRLLQRRRAVASAPVQFEHLR
jgi:hypothetical protein